MSLAIPNPSKVKYEKKPLKTTCQYLTVPFQSGSPIHTFLFSSFFAVLWTVDWVMIHGYLLPAVRQLQHSRISFSSIAKDYHSWKDYAIVYSDKTLIILSPLGWNLAMKVLRWKAFLFTATVIVLCGGIGASSLNVSTETNSTSHEGNTTAVKEDREFVFCKFVGVVLLTILHAVVWVNLFLADITLLSLLLGQLFKRFFD